MIRLLILSGCQLHCVCLFLLRSYAWRLWSWR